MKWPSLETKFQISEHKGETAMDKTIKLLGLDIGLRIVNQNT
jgi:hypothetical protein